MRYLFKMEYQDLLNQNNGLAKKLQEKEQELEKLRQALNQVALPALNEYESLESGPLQMIAKKAKEMILELLK